MGLEKTTDNSVLISLKPSGIHTRPGGYISGPTQFTAADMALWGLAAIVAGKPEPMALTSDLAIRYLRPAIGEHLYARATADKLSKRTVIGSVSLWTDNNENKACAIAQGTYVMPNA